MLRAREVSRHPPGSPGMNEEPFAEVERHRPMVPKVHQCGRYDVLCQNSLCERHGPVDHNVIKLLRLHLQNPSWSKWFCLDAVLSHRERKHRFVIQDPTESIDSECVVSPGDLSSGYKYLLGEWCPSKQVEVTAKKGNYGCRKTPWCGLHSEISNSP